MYVRGDRERLSVKPFVAALLLLATWSGADIAFGFRPGPAVGKKLFAPGQVIVKFKPAIAGAAAPLVDGGAPGWTGDAKLDHLNAKYSCTSMRAVFRRVNDRDLRGRVPSATAHLLQQAKRRYPARAARAPKAAVAPVLDNIHLLEIDEKADVLRAAMEYGSLPGVEYAQPNFVYRAQGVPNDPYFTSSNSWGQGYADMWGLHIINASAAWDATRGDGIIVAVVDTGVDLDHTDLAANVWTNPGESLNGQDDDGNGFVDDVWGWDFHARDNDPTDECGHGTHCAGTIAAVGNNGTGVVGLAYEAKIMSLRGLGPDGRGYSSDLAEALLYAADNGADVISNSWGGFATGDATIRNAVDYAYAAGCVITAAAGNQNGVVIFHEPAGLVNVISVAAFDHNDHKASCANFGSRIDIAAPGGDSAENEGSNKVGRNVLSLRADSLDMYSDMVSIVSSNYYRARGTSMACPHASALAALILSADPSLTVEQVRQVIRTTATDVDDAGWDRNSGYGRIDAANAVAAQPPCVAHFTAPEPERTAIGGFVQIKGAAWGPGFQDYIVQYGHGVTPSQWTTHYIGNAPVQGDELAPALNVSGFDLGPYTLRLTVNSPNGQYVDRVVFRIPLPSQAGWPVVLNDPEDPDAFGGSSGPKIADLDQDGINDVVCASNKCIRAYTGSGGLPAGSWPFASAEGWLKPATTVAVCDALAAHAGNEVIAVDESTVHVDQGLNLYAINRGERAGGGQILTWGTVESAQRAVVLCDIDRDGTQEALYQDGPRDNPFHPGKVHAVELDGTPVAGGWPISVMCDVGGRVCIGNVDADPELEVAFISRDHRLHLVERDAAYVDGWPMDLAALLGLDDPWLSEPSMIDIDEDGLDEILLAVGPYLCAFDADGTQVGGFPVEFIAGECELSVPIAGDLNRDGHLEIVIAAEDKIFQFDRHGNMMPGWPVPVPSMKGWGMVIGDVDGDGDEEVAATSGFTPTIYVFHHDGTMVDGWPFIMFGQMWSLAAPAIGDIDGDGDAELVAHAFSFGTSALYAFDCEGVPARPKPDSWPSHCNNLRNHSRYYSFVRGGFSLQGGVSRALTVTVELKNRTTQEITAHDLSASSDRELIVAEVAVGPHDMTVKPFAYLRKRFDSIAVPPGGADLELGEFTAGDLNNDNRISWLDIGPFSGAYGSTPGMPNWNPHADLNGDGAVNWPDIALISANYGSVGVAPLR